MIPDQPDLTLIRTSRGDSAIASVGRPVLVDPLPGAVGPPPQDRVGPTHDRSLPGPQVVPQRRLLRQVSLAVPQPPHRRDQAPDRVTQPGGAFTAFQPPA